MTFGIALPPVLNEASQSVKDEVCRDVITSVLLLMLLPRRRRRRRWRLWLACLRCDGAVVGVRFALFVVLTCCCDACRCALLCVGWRAATGYPLSGKKIMSLAVTEPYAGSDVAGLLTTAVKERNAQTGEEYYVVNGLKKFITGGTRASYFTTAVRTSGPGMRGVSVLCIPAELEGVKATRMKTQGSVALATGTTPSRAKPSQAKLADGPPQQTTVLYCAARVSHLLHGRFGRGQRHGAAA